jgi:putative transcriptional regulator
MKVLFWKILLKVQLGAEASLMSMAGIIFRFFAATLISGSVTVAHAQQGVSLANGVFLVAKPMLIDSQFRETVVLITELEAGSGPIGVIINRPLDIRLSKLISGIHIPASFDHGYGGGPVALTQLFFLLHSHEQPAHSVPVLADVYLSGDRRLLESVMRGNTKVSAFHAYVGYSGWAPEQLQLEIASGGWYVMQADAETIFRTDSSKIWPELMRRAASQYTAVPNHRSQQLASLSIK